MFIQWEVHLVLHLFAFFIRMYNWVLCMCLKPVDIFGIVTRRVKKCLTFYWTKVVITMFRRVLYCLRILSQMNPLHTIPHHPICLRELLIPFFYLCIDFKVIPFLQIFWAKLVCIYFPILICAPCHVTVS